MFQWIPTLVRWVCFVVVVWLCLQTVPASISQFIDWRREESCLDRDWSWQQTGFQSDTYECVEPVDSGSPSVVD